MGQSEQFIFKHHISCDCVFTNFLSSSPVHAPRGKTSTSTSTMPSSGGHLSIYWIKSNYCTLLLTEYLKRRRSNNSQSTSWYYDQYNLVQGPYNSLNYPFVQICRLRICAVNYCLHPVLYTANYDFCSVRIIFIRNKATTFKTMLVQGCFGACVRALQCESFHLVS